MSYFLHHSFIISCDCKEKINLVHAKAVVHFADTAPVSNLRKAYTNNWYSFAVLPDVGKEEFEFSNRADILREEFKAFLKSPHMQNTVGALKWTEVEFE